MGREGMRMGCGEMKSEKNYFPLVGMMGRLVIESCLTDVLPARKLIYICQQLMPPEMLNPFKSWQASCVMHQPQKGISTWHSMSHVS